MRRVIIWLYEVIFIEIFFFCFAVYILSNVFIICKNFDRAVFCIRKVINASLVPLNLFYSVAFDQAPHPKKKLLYCIAMAMSIKLFASRRLTQLTFCTVARTYAAMVSKEIGSVQFWNQQLKKTKTWTFGTFGNKLCKSCRPFQNN